LLPPIRNADPEVRDVHATYREEQSQITAMLETVARRFGRGLDHVVWEGRAAEALPLNQRPEGARLLDGLTPSDIVLVPRLGDLLSAAADAPGILARFNEQRARLFLTDLQLELTGTGDTARRALELLASLSDTYDERRRSLWAAQDQGRVAALDRFDATMRQQAADAIRDWCENPATFSASDDGLRLDPTVEGGLHRLLAEAEEAAGTPQGETAALSRTIAAALGIRLTQQQIEALRQRWHRSRAAAD
jgi:hypothetical protein